MCDLKEEKSLPTVLGKFTHIIFNQFIVIIYSWKTIQIKKYSMSQVARIMEEFAKSSMLPITELDQSLY